ncbi:MAG: SDR family NAD(P)-dependent oxidoreductase, partial [Chloroflexota bacterium]
NQTGKSVSKWGGFIDDIWDFDPGFFKLSKEEALFIDPQHRILLELAYEAIADAGYTAAAFKGKRAGVFIGIAQEDYKNDAVAHLFSGQKSHPTVLANNLRSMAAGRIADSLNLKGPTFAIDSACSSALVAMHYARLSIENGDCDFAFVGGVNLNISPTSFLAFSNAGALAPNPKCYLFDERNHGILLGEGAGMILLARAEAETGNALAFLRGTAVNNDGQSHGPMTPNTAGQQRVIRTAYETSGINPADIDYIEAHGTGTPLGDIVEARTLNRFLSRLEEEQFRTRYVGSVKPNVGHLLSAAGITSLIKVILSLHHRQIPPSLNCQQPSHRLRFKEVGLVVNDRPVDWPSRENEPRIAGINAFAFGGTNAHVILQSASETARTPLEPPQFKRQKLRILPQPKLVSENIKPLTEQHSPWLHHMIWETQPLLPITEIKAPNQYIITSAKADIGQRMATQLNHQGLDCSFYEPSDLRNQAQNYQLVILANGETPSEFVFETAKQIADGRYPESLMVVTHSSTKHLGRVTNQISSFALALTAELGMPVSFIDFDQSVESGVLYAELLRPPTNDLIIWRNGQRKVRRIKLLESKKRLDPSPLSADGVYLITGGGSGVGAAIAKGIALDLRPTLILVGRQSLSDTLDRDNFLGKLRWAGATADYVSTDVTDLDQVEELIKVVLQKYGRLDGFIAFGPGVLEMHAGRNIDD